MKTKKQYIHNTQLKRRSMQNQLKCLVNTVAKGYKNYQALKNTLYLEKEYYLWETNYRFEIYSKFYIKMTIFENLKFLRVSTF